MYGLSLFAWSFFLMFLCFSSSFPNTSTTYPCFTLHQHCPSLPSLSPTPTLPFTTTFLHYPPYHHLWPYHPFFLFVWMFEHMGLQLSRPQPCLHQTILIPNLTLGFQGAFTHGQGVSRTLHHSYLRAHFGQLDQSTTLLLPTREEAVQPGMSGVSGSFSKNLSNSLLNFSMLHSLYVLVFE